MSVTWLAGVLAAVIVVAVVSLVLLYVVGQPFGTLNDVANALIGIVAAALAVAALWALGGSPFWTAVACVGAALAVIGSWLVISGTTGFVLAGFVSSLGFALVGAWLVAACLSTPPSPVLPDGVRTLGVVTGAAMAFGIVGLGGVTLRVDSFDSTPAWLWLFSVGWLGTYVLLPVWAYLVARSGLVAQAIG